LASSRGKHPIAEMPCGGIRLRLRFELLHERGKARWHRGGERVVLGLERAPERREPRVPIASERRLAAKRPLKARRANGRLRRCAWGCRRRRRGLRGGGTRHIAGGAKRAALPFRNAPPDAGCARCSSCSRVMARI